MAAEDEDRLTLEHFFVETVEYQKFARKTSSLKILRGEKGTGKSAMLHRLRHTLPERDQILLRADEFPAVAEDGENYQRWTATVLQKVAAHLGTQVDWGVSGDGEKLLRIAEQQGEREVGLVSRLVSAAAPKMKVGPLEFSLQNPEAVAITRGLVRRRLESRDPVWLFVDDIDANFVNCAAQRAYVGGFYDVCRQLATELKLRIRTTARASVWACVAAHDAEKDKFRKFLVDLNWCVRREELRGLIPKRIWAYLQANHTGEVSSHLSPTSLELLDFAFFERDLPWRNARSPIDRVLATLSSWRPRWMIRLCLLMAEKSVELGDRKISDRAHELALTEFSKEKRSDLQAEYRHEHPNLRQVLGAFQNGGREYQHDDLCGLLAKNQRQWGVSTPAGDEARAGLVGLVEFLYRIGFLVIKGTSGDHLRVEDWPDACAGDPQGRVYVIESVFRKGLHIH